MEQLILTTWSTVLTAFVGYAVWLLKEDKKKREKKETEKSLQIENISKGTKCLLRAELIRDHDKWVALGHITSDGLHCWIEMFTDYTALGGNGVIVHMDEDIHELPVRNDKGDCHVN